MERLTVGFAVFLVVGGVTAASLLVALARMPPKPASTGNPLNDTLLALSYAPDRQANFLASAVGKTCEPSRPFYLGMMDGKKAVWSVRCANDRDWLVIINPDKEGSGRTLGCNLALLAHISCYETFADQDKRRKKK